MDLSTDYRFRVNCQITKNNLSFKLNNLNNYFPIFNLEITEVLNNELVNKNINNNYFNVVYGKSYNLVAKLKNFNNDFLIHSCKIFSLSNKFMNNYLEVFFFTLVKL